MAVIKLAFLRRRIYHKAHQHGKLVTYFWTSNFIFGTWTTNSIFHLSIQVHIEKNHNLLFPIKINNALGDRFYRFICQSERSNLRHICRVFHSVHKAAPLRRLTLIFWETRRWCNIRWWILFDLLRSKLRQPSHSHSLALQIHKLRTNCNLNNGLTFYLSLIMNIGRKSPASVLESSEIRLEYISA